MKKMMIATIVTVSIMMVGCGKTDNTVVATDKTAPKSETDIFEPITEAENESVAQPSNEEVAEPAEEAVVAEEAPAASDYVSNGLYDSSKVGAWSWQEIDDYLNSYPNIQKYWTSEGYFDLDMLANDLGYEALEIEGYEGADYWLERGDLKVSLGLGRNSYCELFVEDATETTHALLPHTKKEQESGTSKLLCDYFDENEDRSWWDRETSLIRVKGIVALMIYFAKEQNINMMNLPAPSYYNFTHYDVKFNFTKQLELIDYDYRESTARNMEEIKIDAP